MYIGISRASFIKLTYVKYFTLLWNKAKRNETNIDTVHNDDMKDGMGAWVKIQVSNEMHEIQENNDMNTCI